MISGIIQSMPAVFALWQREVVRFLRQPSRVAGALITPVVFWVLLGSGLSHAFSPQVVCEPGGVSAAATAEPPRMQYLEYFFPGALSMIVLFTAIFSTISVIEDRREGFLQGVIVAPVGRAAIVWGKILGSATLALSQAVLFLCLAPFGGIWPGPGEVVVAALVIALVGIGLSGMGFLIAWRMESSQGFHAIVNLFLMPMWLLSGAIFPSRGASSLVGAVMLVNPLTYGVAGIRQALYMHGAPLEHQSLPSLMVCLVVTTVFAFAMVGWCTRLVGRTG